MRMFYNIKLDIFEGPFDLLLFLIQKEEVDIYNIPISKITMQFIEYVEDGTHINLEHAGEFIEMIAVLMKIKTQMLLPKPEQTLDEELEDPRTELVNRLIEYKRFKDISEELDTLQTKATHLVPRTDFSYLQEIANQSVQEEGSFISSLSLYDLIKAYKKALDEMPQVTEHQVETVQVSLEDQSEFILNQLTQYKTYYFSDLMKAVSHKLVIVVSFIALLDLIRLSKVIITQNELFNDILIEAV